MTRRRHQVDVDGQHIISTDIRWTITFLRSGRMRDAERNRSAATSGRAETDPAHESASLPRRTPTGARCSPLIDDLHGLFLPRATWAAIEPAADPPSLWRRVEHYARSGPPAIIKARNPEEVKDVVV